MAGRKRKCRAQTSLARVVSYLFLKLLEGGISEINLDLCE